MKKKIFKGFIIFLLVLAVFTVGLFSFILLGRGKTLNLDIGNVELDKISDGVYTGNYDGFRWSNSVKVTVKDHKITEIQVVKPQAFAKKENYDSLSSELIRNQSLEVDIVSGATADSKAFLKAVENALK